MARRDILAEWLVEALKAKSGSASIVELCKYVWEHHEEDLRESEALFYT